MKSLIPKIFGFLIIFILFCTFSSIIAQWQKHIIEDKMQSPVVSVNAADLDSDNQIDLLVTNGGGKKIILFQNDFPNWNKSIIDNFQAPFASTGDMDGDETLDVVACLYSARKMVWYENNLPTGWTKHIIAENTNWNDYVVISDLNNDSKLDVVSAVTTSKYNKIGHVIWYENNLPTGWSEHIIESNVIGCGFVDVNDIDGDGLQDVILTLDKENDVVWYKNNHPDSNWTKKIIDDNLKFAFVVSSGDVNGDGKIDIVVATGGPYFDGSSVVLYVNNFPFWTERVIDANLQGATGVEIIDVDGDGMKDIVAGGFADDNVVWYKNNHPTWVKKIIDDNLDGPRIFTLADLDGDEVNDLIVPGLYNVVWYKNPYTTIAYGRTLEVYPKYISPQIGDTLNFTAEISNPENHLVNAYVLIDDDQNIFKDSIELFDDGLHNDGESSDNILGGSRWFKNVAEQDYTIKLFVTDQTTTILPPIKTHFTTKGPIIIKDCIMFNDTLPNPGDEIPLKLELMNISNSDTVFGVDGFLSCLDTSLSHVTMNSNTKYGDIAPGESTITAGGYRIKIADNCHVDTTISFKVDISSNGHLYWEDTLTIKIDEPTRIKNQLLNLPAEYMLTQNYPNPFNPSTTIKYAIPNVASDISLSNVTLRIYDILGREVAALVNEKQRPGNYEIKFDVSRNSATRSELTSGIYFYRLTAGEFIETKKMVLLK